jgi:hypothetical protein
VIGATDAAAVDAAPRPLPTLGTSAQVCKLLSNLNTSDPSPNDVQHKANILGADLGIPVDSAGTLFFFFGDTIGFAGIWGTGSHPDSVGYATASTSAVVAAPSALCNGLDFLTLPPGSSVGPTVNPAVVADFAGGYMTAPTGHTLGEYIHNPAGGGGTTYPNLPGDFEVPSGAFAYGGAVYLLYTTVVSPSDITMKGSYLARWAAPSTTGSPGYDVLYAVDERFDDAGALAGDFVNVAAETSGAYVYLFGTGAYRASPVHLARKALSTLDTPGGFERFDATSGAWVPAVAGATTAPIIDVAGYGETSVRYFAAMDRWMFLAEELTATSNRIVARWADRPEGPWSDATVVHDMADPAFRAAYCCTPDDQCAGAQFLDCDKTGFYGSYLLPGVQVGADGGFTAVYTLSSFAPYDVAVFTTTFH